MTLRSVFIILIFIAIPSLSSASETNPAICQVLKQHKPDQDVHHKADANVSTDQDFQALPDKIVIPITIDIAEQISQDLPDGTLLESNFGQIEIHSDGSTIYNGQDISAQLSAYCEETTVKEKTSFTSEPSTSEPSLQEPQLSEPRLVESVRGPKTNRPDIAKSQQSDSTKKVNNITGQATDDKASNEYEGEELFGGDN